MYVYVYMYASSTCVGGYGRSGKICGRMSTNKHFVYASVVATKVAIPNSEGVVSPRERWCWRWDEACAKVKIGLGRACRCG